jgi:hypothetical protein
MSVSPVSSNSLLNSATLPGLTTDANQNTTSTKAVSSSSSLDTSPSNAKLSRDMNSLRWDMTSGNTPAAKADVNRVKADLLAEEDSIPSSNTFGSPLDISVDSISDSLSDGSN